MLRLEHVTKHYKGFDLECSMEVRKGCVTGLVGKNGAGKSTTFKAILGLISPEGGSLQVFGKPAQDLDLQDKARIGVVLSDSGFSGSLTVQELIPILRAMYPDFQKDNFLKKCEEFSIPTKKKLQEFSTGMKQKLQVLTAISHNARLLVLDEPTAGLDVIARDHLLDLLREYMEPGDRSILISSHISADLEGFCDDLYMIHEGKIILHEDTDVLLDSYALLKMTKEQYDVLDKSYVLRYKKETFGYSCLTNQKQFYLENHPEITVEKGSIDELIVMMICGKALG